MVAPARTPLRTDRLRAVNEPRPVTVDVNSDGSPASIQAMGGRADGPMGGKIGSVNEIWRIDDEWWRKQISRSYYEVMMEGGKRIVVFIDLLTNEWFMQQP